MWPTCTPTLISFMTLPLSKPDFHLYCLLVPHFSFIWTYVCTFTSHAFFAGQCCTKPEMRSARILKDTSSLTFSSSQLVLQPYYTIYYKHCEKANKNSQGKMQNAKATSQAIYVLCVVAIKSALGNYASSSSSSSFFFFPFFFFFFSYAQLKIPYV